MQQENKNKTVLIIDDNEDDYRIISRNISNHYNAEYCVEISNHIEQITKLKPDCILLDYHMELENGINLLKKLKSTKGIRKIPVIMMTGEENPDIIIQCMKNNAEDYLIKGKYDKERILHAIDQAIINADLKKKIEEQQKLILEISRTDELTGVYSRRYLMERIDDEILRSKRRKGTFSITMVDLDSFKKINDEYGHLTGDIVLKDMTRIIKEGIRNTDYVGRFGGDEFIIVLIDFEKKEKNDIIQNHGKILDKIRKNISNSAVIPSAKEIVVVDHDITKDIRIKKAIHYSGTFGYTLFNDSISTASDLLANADRALYGAKENGKNCVAFYDNGKIIFYDKEITNETA